MATARVQLVIQGAVQGVGFRPFVYRLAKRFEVTGHVRNAADGVHVEAEGPRAVLDSFITALREERPPLSRIESIEAAWTHPQGDRAFEIRHSNDAGDPLALIMADIATCPDCLRDIHNPADRRYRYPFTNCTNCGPRFSLLHRLPYDRANTSMRLFEMCAACRAEYENPADRRFHAQPTACPACGPRLALWDSHGETRAEEDTALREAAEALRNGRLLAVKGLGGFHLMADARNEEAVRRLRARKHRAEKPFALMYPSTARAREDCAICEYEAALLESPESPIVLLPRKVGEGCLAEAVAPGCPRLGVMLPATPLHHLLLEELGFPVVATSGNLSEEPICIDEYEALERLDGIAEGYLVHNRPIVRHVDDSIVQWAAGREMVLRRARGYAPLPIPVSVLGPDTVAFGSQLKNTVAVAKHGRIFLSQHIGDLETPRAFDAFVEAASALERLYGVSPQQAACDLHPDYLASRHARTQGLPLAEVQHHFAHVVACMAEHGLAGPVLGVSWDGTGYGLDGTIWGGEFLRTTLDGFERVGHLRTFRLPGGDRAAHEPRRSALGLLFSLAGGAALFQEELPPLQAFSGGERNTLESMLTRAVNSPETSSAGRLFDAVAALLDLHQQCSFEGQAAMALQFAAERNGPAAPIAEFGITRDAAGLVLDWEPVVKAILEARKQNMAVERVAAGFHAAAARGIAAMADKIGIADVVLTGGCFQNVLLLEWTIAALEECGLRPHWPWRVPPNDGGLALGQAFFALRRAIQA